MDDLSESAITAGLDTVRVGRWRQRHNLVGSTNQLARQMVDDPKWPDGSVVLAEYQSSGRGRLGRTWHAPMGSSILASFLLRPTNLPAARAFALTMALASAARAALTGLYPQLHLALKWPNDLLADALKLGGILCEVGFERGAVAWAVLGIGINVNVGAAAVAVVSDTATSVQLALNSGPPIPRAPIFCALCHALEGRYLALQAGEYATIRQEWADNLCWVGRIVRVNDTSGRTVLVGQLLGVDEDGALLVQPPTGMAQRIVAGDLSLRLG